MSNTQPGGPGSEARDTDPSGRATVTGTVGPSAVPESVLERGGLPRVDYVDHFVLSPADGHRATPDQWARRMFGDCPSRTERFIWRGLLRLHLHRGKSASTIAGWTVAAHGPDWVRMETASRMATAALVVRATETELSLTTFMRYDRPAGRLIWAALSPVHRRLSPGILTEAVGTVTRFENSVQ